MTAARSAPQQSQAAATSVRLGRVHTIRIPEPLWRAIGVRAVAEVRRDGASEIVREIVEDDVRKQLIAKGIVSGREVSMDDVERYSQMLLGYGLDAEQAPDDE